MKNTTKKKIEKKINSINERLCQLISFDRFENVTQWLELSSRISNQTNNDKYAICNQSVNYLLSSFSSSCRRRRRRRRQRRREKDMIINVSKDVFLSMIFSLSFSVCFRLMKHRRRKIMKEERKINLVKITMALYLINQSAGRQRRRSILTFSNNSKGSDSLLTQATITSGRMLITKDRKHAEWHD